MLTAEQRRALRDHVRLLLAWNAAINLTAIREPAAVARLHVVDALSAVPLLRTIGISRLLDLGSGGGFPGVPLAVVVPASAHLVESVGKKARFLQTAASALALDRVTTEAARAETIAARPDGREAWPAVTARAVAGVGELVELAFPLLQPGGVLLAWKRGELRDEVAAGRRAADALGGGSVEVVDPGVPGLPGHRLVVARKRSVTPPGWPREPGVRRRRPW